MAFQRPTLAQLIDRIESDFISRLSLSGAVLRRAVIYVVARALAGAVHMLYGFLDFLAKQLFPDTVAAEFLDRYANRYGITRRGATFATGGAVVTGSNGSFIPTGTILQRADERQYRTTALAEISSGSASLGLIAQDAGADGGCPSGTALSFISPLSGVSAQATVGIDGITGGTDQESDDELRARLAARTKAPPLGGAIHDYEFWAKEVTGVTRVWVYPLEGGAGTLTVRFVCDDDPDSIIPDSPKVTEVQDHIDEVRPVTAIVTVAAPVADTLNFNIVVSPATAPVKAAIEAELRDLLKRDASPGGTVFLSRIQEAISIAAGESDHTLVAPSANVVSATGHMPVFGMITWS